jgi:hypothetical protein
MVNGCDQCIMGVAKGSCIDRIPAIHSILRFGADLFRLLQSAFGFSAFKLSCSHWSIVFLGPKKGLPEFCSLFSEEGCQCEELGRIGMFAARKAVRRWLDGEAEMVVCESSLLMQRFLRADIALAAPLWFEMLLPLPENPETLLAGKKKASIRNKINRFLRNGFGYQYSCNKEAFLDFHERMYVPFVTSRHKELARVTPAETQCAWWMRKGGILQVCQNNKPVAGTICYVDKGTCYAIETGVVDSGDGFFNRGINDFSLWCIICWAHENGANFLNLGGTRPFRSNGSYIHKHQWGAFPAVRRRSSPMWHFLAQDIGAALQQRLNELKLICQNGDQLYSVYFGSNAEKAQANQFNQALQQACREGLAGLVWAARRRPMRVYARLHTDSPLTANKQTAVV